MTEQWRAIPGYEGLYEVSDTGRVRSLDRIDCAGSHRKGKVLSPSRDRYLGVRLARNGGVAPRLIHQLVLEGFVGPRPEGMECRHLNGDPWDNRLENLSWGTKAENTADILRMGRTMAGEKNRHAKVTSSQAAQIRSSGGLLREVRDVCGLSLSQISKIRRGECWANG